MSQANEFLSITVSLTSMEKDVRNVAFGAIYRGVAPFPSQLANDLGLSIEGVDTAIASLMKLGLMTVDEIGRVTGSHGISLIPSVHRVAFDVGERFVWCAVDAVGIPAAMGVDAKIESQCFACGEAVSLTIRAGQPQGEPAERLRIGIAIDGCTGKVIEDVCPMLNFFCSQEHAGLWAADVNGASIITVQQAAELGRATWSDIADIAR